MKTAIVGLLALLVLCPQSDAQVVRGFGFKIGGIAANQSWQYGATPEAATDYRWDFTAAAFVELLDFPFFSAVVEVQYARKGMSESIPVTTAEQPDGSGAFMTLKPRADYLSLPILAKVRLPSPSVSPYLIAGPRFDFLVSSKGDGFDAVLDNFKSYEFGATVGAGVELNSLLPVDLLAEFRYNPSFTNAFSNNYLNVKNRSFDVLVGVRL